MSDAATLHDVERELDRVVDRLMSMPLAKASTAMPDVMGAAQALLDHCRLIDPQVPDDAMLPSLAPQGLGPLIAVLGTDWLAAARTSTAPDSDGVLDVLVRLRRALP
jgi:hypothetical protein